jgi:glycosyltransferase involved in cell wall biosynthesis
MSRAPAGTQPEVEEQHVLRVGFDDQIFVAQRRGGISKYFVELFSRLPQFGIEPVVWSRGTRNLHLAESGLVPRLPDYSRAMATATYVSWRLAGVPRTVQRPAPPVDVMHHTFTNPRYLREWAGPRVVTVFDMTPELFPSYFPRGNPHFAKRRYCEVSDAIISISQNTADDLYRIYSPDLERKTHVIPFGVGAEFFERGTPELELPPRYLLFVGVRYGYKHFDVAFESFRTLAAEDPGLELVVVGGGEFSSGEASMFEEAGVTPRVRRITPSDAEMPEVYRRASAFMFPSIYEGFGLPTLEALASGTPTVLADASCSREVGGEAALYAAPGDVADFTAQLRIALSPGVTMRAAREGPSRARTFNWDDLASATAAVYRAVAEGAG